MDFKITRTESGDWFVVQADYAEQFVDDELEDKIDDLKHVRYIGHPETVTFKEYSYE